MTAGVTASFVCHLKSIYIANYRQQTAIEYWHTMFKQEHTRTHLHTERQEAEVHPVCNKCAMFLLTWFDKTTSCGCHILLSCTTTILISSKITNYLHWYEKLSQLSSLALTWFSCKGAWYGKDQPLMRSLWMNHIHKAVSFSPKWEHCVLKTSFCLNISKDS